MKDSVYLIFDLTGVKAMTKRTPKLKSGEFATMVILECPDTFFFQIMPVVHAKIGDDFVIKPAVTVTPQKPEGQRGNA